VYLEEKLYSKYKLVCFYYVIAYS
jgi:hypothetical protein